MILLTRLSGRPFTLNADLIERIDSTPDTVITLVDGKKYVVAQTAHEVREAVLAYRSRIFADSGLLGSADEEGPDGPTRAARRA
jgi:flagellar protein FlbD